MLRSSLVITILTLCASLLGFAVQLLLAQRYGVGVEVDAYLFSISFPTFLASVVSGILSFNLIPRLVSAQGDPEFHRKFMGSLVIGIVAISLALVIGTCGAMLMLKDHLLPDGSKILQYDDLELLIFLASLVAGVQIIQGCISAMLNSEKKYKQSALISLLPYVGMLALLLLLDKDVGIKLVATGLLLGTISTVLIGTLLLRKYIFPLPWGNISWNPLWKTVQSSVYTALAMTCFSAYAIVDAYWGPRSGDGTLAALGYAQRIVIAVGNLAVAGPSAVLVPNFAGYLRDKNFHGFIKLMHRTFLIVSAVAISVGLFLGIFAIYIVELLFGYGAFGAKQISQVASTIINMAPGMIFMLVSVIGMRVLFCFESSYKQTALLGLGWTIGYFLASSYAHQYGAPGIALAYSFTWFLYFVIISIIIYRKTRNFNA
jgi:putative peptidoglycan lipid II flippase